MGPIWPGITTGREARGTHPRIPASGAGAGLDGSSRLSRRPNSPGSSIPSFPSRDPASRFLLSSMIEAEDICEPEWAEWYRMTPQQRWEATERMWADYLALGGSLEPEPDMDSPFFDAETSRPMPLDGRPGVRVIRRSGV